MIDGLQKGDFPTAKEMEHESRVGLTEAVLTAYLTSNGYTPCNPPYNAGDRTVVRSTDDICDELAPICDLDPNDVAEIMLRKGFTLTFPRSGKLGWQLTCRHE